MEIQLLGRHLLGHQIEDLFRHESVVVHRHETLTALLREPCSRAPVILWNTDNRQAIADAARLRQRGLRTHRYWVGGDVLRIMRLGATRTWLMSAANRLLFGSHTANSPWLATELAPLHLQVDAQPINPACCAAHWPLAAAQEGRLSVIYYSLQGQDAIYQPQLFFALAEALPSVRFLAVGNPELRGGSENIEHRGPLSPRDYMRLYSEAHALLRLTTHDGLPRTVLEAMTLGLGVLTNLSIPHTHLVRNLGDAIRTLHLLDSLPRTRNCQARAWALDNFSAKPWTSYWHRRLAHRGYAQT